MHNGDWMIVLQAETVNFQVVREFRITVTVPEKVYTTVTPTVVVGVTTTARGVSKSTTWLSIISLCPNAQFTLKPA